MGHCRGVAAASRLRDLFLAALPLAAASCTGSQYSGDADRDVAGVLEEFDRRALADRASRVQMPALLPEPPPPVPERERDGAAPRSAYEFDESAAVQAPAAANEPAREPLVLDLKTALSIAVERSRRFKDQKESLYLTGMGFTVTKFNYGPQFSSAVSFVWGDGDGASATSSAGGSFGVSQLLPTNGSVSLSAGLTKAWARDDGGAGGDWSTSTGINLTQPLLRRAGYDLYREGLTQAERSLVYSVRAFERFREQFTIDITQQYFGLVGQKRQIANSEHDLESATFDQDKTEALAFVGRLAETDVISTRRRRIDAESQVEDRRTAFRRAVQSFLIDLGLDPSTPVELKEEEPPFEPVRFDPVSAVQVALATRLDVQTERDRFDDAERQFRLARNDLLPDLDLTASYSSSGAGNRPGGALPDTWSRSAGVSLEIPLQTIQRRNAWRQAEISIEQTRRNWTQYLDSEKSRIEDALREVRNTERQIELAEQSIVDEEKNVDRLEIQFERVSGRDLVEARQKLVDRRNGLIEAKVRHLIQRLTLYMNLGILFIGRDGNWSVGTPASEDVR